MSPMMSELAERVSSCRKSSSMRLTARLRVSLLVNVENEVGVAQATGDASQRGVAILRGSDALLQGAEPREDGFVEEREAGVLADVGPAALLVACRNRNLASASSVLREIRVSFFKSASVYRAEPSRRQ